MTWLVRDKEENLRASFRELLAENRGIIKIPGTHDALVALLAKKAGFEALYLSGGAFSASLRLPDLGIITLSELAQRVMTDRIDFSIKDRKIPFFSRILTYY